MVKVTIVVMLTILFFGDYDDGVGDDNNECCFGWQVRKLLM